MKRNEKGKSKLWRRITWRVFGILVLFNVLIIAAIVRFVMMVSLVSSSWSGQYVADGIASYMETMMQVVRTVAVNNRAVVEDNLESPEQLFEALERGLRVNKRLSGCFVALEPDYFGGQGRWFEAYAYYADSTRIVRRQIGSSQHDYFQEAWYKKGLGLATCDEGFLTDPSVRDSVGSGQYSNYILPLFDRRGRRVGVYGVVLNVGWLDDAIWQEIDNLKRGVFEEGETLALSDDEVYFSIQMIDSKGQRVAGSDSLDLSILEGTQEKAVADFEMMDLKDTHYYVNTKRLAHTDWTLVVLQHYETVFMWGFLLTLGIILCMSVGGVVIFIFMRRSIRRATQPLGYLSASAQEVAKGNFDTDLPTFKHDDEVAELRDSFDTMQQSLKRYVEELKASTAAKASIESELNVAHSIQMSMLPKTFPAFPNRKDIELYASLTPAKGVGGDLYDFFIRDEKLFFCIGDVSGKGVPASLVMAVTRTLFRNVAAHATEPNHIVETMNTNICEGNDNCMFVTLFAGVLDLLTGHLCYCNAGHDAPYLIEEGKAKGDVCASLLPCDSNLPVGVVTGMAYSGQETTMTPGTTLFLYTDGLTEAENASHELFGSPRVADTISAFTGSSQSLIETMTAAVHRFVGDTEQSDDLTMLAFKYNACTRE